MHVLMMFQRDQGTASPGHDGLCEIFDAAREISVLGARVTILESGVRAGTCTGDEAQPGHQQTGSQKIRYLHAPRLGVIPLARASRMSLVVLLQDNLSGLQVLADGWKKGDRFDVVHCFGWQIGLAAGLLGQMMNLPVVVTARDLIADRSRWLRDPKEAYSRFVWEWLLARCAAIICPDQQMKNKIADLFLIAEEHLIVLPPRLSSLNTRSGGRRRNTKEPTVLFAGSPNRADGLEHLLRACARLQEERKTRVRLFLYGPDSRGRCPAAGGLIRRSGLAEQILFLKPEADAGWWAGVLSASDLMVLSDPVEFIGNVVLGALSSGVPVLAAQCPAVRSMFGELGEEMTYPPGRDERLAALMERLLFDDQVSGRLAAGLDRLSREWRSVGPGLLSLYRHVCDQRRSADRKGGETDAVRNPQLGGGGNLRQ